MIDIDYFKQYNDRYGHDEGDKVLAAVADDINSAVEDTCEIAVRWGGEEFIYAAFNKKRRDIADIANTIREKVAEMKIINEDSPSLQYITISSGVCTIDVKDKKTFRQRLYLPIRLFIWQKRRTKQGRCVKQGRN